MTQEESRVERAQRFSKIWWQSRAEAGKSQEFLALGLGVSKKTIQNWEKGISSPDLFQGYEWFRILGLNPLPYYLSFLYPNLVDQISPTDEDKDIEEILIELIKNSTVKEKRELYYIMAGKHGSSWFGLLQMMTAHCHTSLQSRVTAANIILENYEMEESTGELVNTDQIAPDLKILSSAIEQGKAAAQKKEQGYTIMY